MQPEKIIEKIKEKAVDFAKNQATENAKLYYTLGKRDAASTFLAMARADGADTAIKDVAEEVLRHDPNHLDAKWIMEK